MARNNVGGLAVDLTLKAQAFIRDMKRAADTVATNSKRMSKELRQVGRAANDVNRKMSQLRTGVAALAGALAVRQFSQFTRQALAAGAALQDTSNRLGVTTDELQALRFAAAQVGVNTRTVDLALQRLTRRAAEAAQGSGELRDTLIQYGIATRTADGRARRTGDILKDLADTIANADSQAERLRIAFKAFDSEGAAFVVALQNGTAGLEEFREEAEAAGLIMGEDIVRQAKLADDALTTLTLAAENGFQTGIIETFAQSLINAREEIKTVRDVAEVFGRVVGNAMTAVARAAGFVADNIDTIAGALAAVVAYKAAVIFGGIAGALLRFAAAARAAGLATTFLNTAIRRNPIVLVATAVAAVIGLLVAYRKETVQIGETSVRVGGVVTAIWATVTETLGALGDVVDGVRQRLVALINLDATAFFESYTSTAAAIDAKLGKIFEAWANITSAQEGSSEALEEVNRLLAEITGESTGLADIGDTIKSAIEDAGRTIEQQGGLLQGLKLDAGEFITGAPTVNFDQANQAIELQTRLVSGGLNVSWREAYQILTGQLTPALNTAEGKLMANARSAVLLTGKVKDYQTALQLVAGAINSTATESEKAEAEVRRLTEALALVKDSLTPEEVARVEEAIKKVGQASSDTFDGIEFALSSAFQKAIENFEDFRTIVGSLLKDVGSVLINENLVEPLVELVTSELQALLDSINIFKTAQDATGTAVDAAGDLAGGAADTAAEQAAAIATGTTIATAMTTAGAGVATTVGTAITTAATAAATAIGTAITTAGTAVAAQIAAASAGGSGAGGLLSLVPSAKGNVFQQLQLAKGGLINTRQQFALANGGAVAGEKSVEAVMPLERDSQGRLGVLAMKASPVMPSEGSAGGGRGGRGGPYQFNFYGMKDAKEIKRNEQQIASGVTSALRRNDGSF